MGTINELADQDGLISVMLIKNRASCITSAVTQNQSDYGSKNRMLCSAVQIICSLVKLLAARIKILSCLTSN